MAQAEVGDPRPIALFEDRAARLDRQHPAERRAVQRERRREGRADRLQERAALVHVLGDVVQVDAGQHAAPAVAVEDDQIEFIQLDLEQLAGREGDQRQLADRRAVLLFRRAQDGEVDQVDRGVGFQNVAPGALAGMGLAGDQQHPQAVAHAVHHRRRPVVGERKLPRSRLDLDLEHARAAVVELEFDFLLDSDRDVQSLLSAAVAAQGNARQARPIPAGQILDGRGHAQLTPDDAEAGRPVDGQAPVALVARAGQQQVQRRIQAERLEVFGHIVNLTVADEYDAGDALARHLGKGLPQGREQAGAVLLDARRRRARAH